MAGLLSEKTLLGVLPDGTRVPREEEKAYWEEQHRKFAQEVLGLSPKAAPTRAPMRAMLAQQSQPLPQMPMGAMQSPAPQGFADQYPVVEPEPSPRVGNYPAPVPTGTKQLSVRDVFNQAYAAAKAQGLKVFPWTNPATGKTQLYTTD